MRRSLLLRRNLATVEDDVLGPLDAGQRETLYGLLQQVTAGHVLDCAAAAAEEPAA